MRNLTVHQTCFPPGRSLRESLPMSGMMQGRSRNRRGSILVEAIVGCIVLGVAISMLLPALSTVRRQRQALRFETLSMLELNNLDRSIPPVINPASLPELSEWFRRRYGKAQLKSELLAEPADAAQPRALRMTISQPSVELMPEQKISVVIWRQLQETAP